MTLSSYSQGTLTATEKYPVEQIRGRDTVVVISLDQAREMNLTYERLWEAQEQYDSLRADLDQCASDAEEISRNLMEVKRQLVLRDTLIYQQGRLVNNYDARILNYSELLKSANTKNTILESVLIGVVLYGVIKSIYGK